MKKKKLFLICLAICIVLAFFMVKIAFSADDWHTPTAINDKCGENVSEQYWAVNMIDENTGTYWYHDVSEEHWIIFDMGETYTVKKVRVYHVPYNTGNEPKEVFVSDNTESWGASVGASTANYWSDAEGWDEIDTTDKDGRYIKLTTTKVDDIMHWFEFDIYGDVSGGPPPPTAKPVQSQILILE